MQFRDGLFPAILRQWQVLFSKAAEHLQTCLSLDKVKLNYSNILQLMDDLFQAIIRQWQALFSKAVEHLQTCLKLYKVKLNYSI